MKPQQLSLVVAFALGWCLAVSFLSMRSAGSKDKQKVAEDMLAGPDTRQLLRQIQKISDQQVILQEQLQQRPDKQPDPAPPVAAPPIQVQQTVSHVSTGFQPIKGEGPNDQCMIEFPFLEADEVYHLIKLWFSANCPANIEKYETCSFRSIGRHLLHHAIQQGKTFVTLQIGAMDGKSNDPLYEMFARTKSWELRNQDKFPNLKNWLPILLEPVPANYENLLKTYKEIDNMKGLPCAIPMNAAISYDSNQTECAFCRYDTSPTAPPECSHADWMRFQIGTLDCEYSKKFFGEKKFETCILKDPLPCGPVKKLVHERAPYLPKDLFIGMVQIDVEAYEYILLQGLVKDLDPLPPIIHFENKVMKQLDRKKPLDSGEKRMQSSLDTLRSVGYQIYEEGEDTLAFLLPEGLQNPRLVETA